jgi:hypothetical protein
MAEIQQQVLVGLPIQAVAVVVVVVMLVAAVEVQALSFFATPAQFNILLVAQ